MGTDEDMEELKLLRAAVVYELAQLLCKKTAFLGPSSHASMNYLTELTAATQAPSQLRATAVLTTRN